MQPTTNSCLLRGNQSIISDMFLQMYTIGADELQSTMHKVSEFTKYSRTATYDKIYVQKAFRRCAKQLFNPPPRQWHIRHYPPFLLRLPIAAATLSHSSILLLYARFDPSTKLIITRNPSQLASSSILLIDTCTPPHLDNLQEKNATVCSLSFD